LVPGPEIRARRGDRIRVTVENRLPEETTVHWHGVRIPNAMDGVPHLTQRPIAPGETFAYEFDLPDAGTYWYHPHQHSSAQVGRGLYGPLIIDESHPIRVDRDLVWVLGDWRLLANAQISDDFDNLHDMAHNGRAGNTVTLNGKVPDTFSVRSGERVRLRLINAANARIFVLEFAGHRPLIVAPMTDTPLRRTSRMAHAW
jgi:FtsP/CotA-like multicopper oxidase with cupredoxin domain